MDIVSSTSALSSLDNESTTKDKVKEDKKRNECSICTSPQEMRPVSTFSKIRPEAAIFLQTQIQIWPMRGWLYVCKRCLSVVELIMGYNKKVEKLQGKISQLTRGLKLKADITKMDFDNIPDVGDIIKEHFECVTLENEAEKATKSLETTLFEALNQSQPKPIANDAKSYNNEMDPMDDHFLDYLMAEDDSEPEMTSIIPPKPKDNRIRNLNSKYYRLTPKTCPVCQKVMDPNNFKRHFKQVHEKVTRFTCSTCGYKCYQKVYYEKHVKTCTAGKTREKKDNKLSDNSGPTQCDKCGKVFAKLSGLTIHTRHFHSEMGETFLCDQCPKGFNMQCKLKRHIKIKHNNENKQQAEDEERLKRFECQFCGKILSSRVKLKHHEASVCGNDEEKKKQHAEYNKQTRDKQKFKCDECGLKLITELGLQRHKERRGKHGPRKRVRKNKKNVNEAVNKEGEIETNSEEDEANQIQNIQIQQQSVQTQQHFFQPIPMLPITYSFPLQTNPNQYPKTQANIGYRYN